MILQITRRCVQAAVLFVVVGVAFLSLYAHYRAAASLMMNSSWPGCAGEVAAKLLHPYVERLDDPQRLLDNNKGTLWSMRLMGINVTDPLAAAELLAASKHIHGPLMLSILIPLGFTIVFGRVNCSWICPGYLLFELTGKLRRLLRFAEINPAEIKFSHRTKYIVLLVGLGVVAVTSAPLFALVYPPAVISRATHAWIFGTALTGMLVLLGTIVAIELFISPRWWCRVICPGGALYGIVGWVRPVRVRLRRSDCTGCQKCIPVCEAGLNPISQSSSIECDNCGVCLRHCEPGALYFTIGLPEPVRKPKVLQAAPLGIGTVVLAIGLLLGGPREASAHHILGLPHYSYKENYPQRPTLEYPATTGPYEVLLTSYPGIPTPGEPANLAFYIKNQQTGVVYSEAITVRILQTSTFGDNSVILPPTTRTPFDNEYKFHATFPEDGEYVIELSMPVEGRVEIIPFLMVAGQPTATASIAAAGSFGCVLIFVVVRAVQKKRRRRQSEGRTFVLPQVQT